MPWHLKHSITTLIFFTVVLSLAQSINAKGCKAEGLGVKVPSSNRIPDKHMTSSSSQSNYQAFRGRIGLESRGSWGDGWCASESDSNPYIQIFFELLTNIQVIESEGVTIDGVQMWVKSYEIQISNDTNARSWTTYTEGDIKQLQANTGVQAKNLTLNNVWAHVIRIYPTSRNGKWKCMRLALYGCQTAGARLRFTEDVLNEAPNTEKPLKETLFLVIPIALFGCLIIAGLFCCFCRHRPKKARQIKEKQEKVERMEKYMAEQASMGHDNGVIYQKPPIYEFQTVSLDFDHDQDKVDGAEEVKSETPVFIDDNKIFSFERNSITYT